MSKALVAVSGGSDSMALLDMLYTKSKDELVVAHINYHYRYSSTRDENIVREYCSKRDIKIYVLDLDSKKEQEGNFENWARVKRYKFFKEIYDKEKCDCLYVGHQKEDLIETYLLQKSRGSLVDYYGLNKETNLQNMRVVRPLLNYTKEELKDYCESKNIKYGVDETNFDLRYKRNKIRNNVISKMTPEEKEAILGEIELKNRKRKLEVETINEALKRSLNEGNKINLDIFKTFDFETKKGILYYYLIKNVYEKISIRDARLRDMIKKIESSKPNIVLATYGEYTLYKEYSSLVITKNKKEYCYKIELNELKNISYIKERGSKLEKVVARESDFPLYLKKYDGKNKDVNRIFIDKKVPLREREEWPMVTDKIGRLLLVIGIKKFYNVEQDKDKNLVEFYIERKEGE